MTYDINKMLETAFAYHHSGDFENAELIYRSILKEHSNNTTVLTLLATLLFQKNELSESERLFKKSIKIDSNQFPSTILLA